MAAMGRPVPAQPESRIVRSEVNSSVTVGCDAPAVPAWARELAAGEASASCVVAGVATGFDVNTTITRGRDATLVSVSIDGVDSWTAESFLAASQALVQSSLEGLRGTGFELPARLWNFLPGICEPLGDGLDRYRVFNVARHREFERAFGATALRDGTLPTASCVGHSARSIAVHALGSRHAASAVENPRQIPAYAYSNKYGPKPPSFSRACVANFGCRRMLLVAGTASVLGEDSVHDGSLQAQCDETLTNLRAVAANGKIAAGHAEEAITQSLDGLCASRVYYRRAADLSWLKKNLHSSLLACREVEFVRADICRDELLVEIEAALDLGTARDGVGARV